ncbi:MAG: hypothetical protein LBV30_10685 [Propionibacteriaceae bacterium]|nr:hypothetical protein [Propionibacteriaceae bacterium]
MPQQIVAANLALPDDWYWLPQVSNPTSDWASTLAERVVNLEPIEPQSPRDVLFGGIGLAPTGQRTRVVERAAATPSDRCAGLIERLTDELRRAAHCLTRTGCEDVRLAVWIDPEAKDRVLAVVAQRVTPTMTLKEYVGEVARFAGQSVRPVLDCQLIDRSLPWGQAVGAELWLARAGQRRESASRGDYQRGGSGDGVGGPIGDHPDVAGSAQNHRGGDGSIQDRLCLAIAGPDDANVVEYIAITADRPGHQPFAQTIFELLAPIRLHRRLI